MWISSRLSIWTATRLTQTHPSGIPQASLATKPNFITHTPLPPFCIPSVKALPPCTSQKPVVQDSRLPGIFEDCCTGHNAELFCDPTEQSHSLSYRKGVWKLFPLIQTLHVLSTDLPATASPSATTLPTSLGFSHGLFSELAAWFSSFKVSHPHHPRHQPC